MNDKQLSRSYPHAVTGKGSSLFLDRRRMSHCCETPLALIIPHVPFLMLHSFCIFLLYVFFQEICFMFLTGALLSLSLFQLLINLQERKHRYNFAVKYDCHCIDRFAIPANHEVKSTFRKVRSNYSKSKFIFQCQLHHCVDQRIAVASQNEIACYSSDPLRMIHEIQAYYCVVKF